MGDPIMCSTTLKSVVEQGGANTPQNHCSTTPPPKGGAGGGGALSGSIEVVEQNSGIRMLLGLTDAARSGLRCHSAANPRCGRGSPFSLLGPDKINPCLLLSRRTSLGSIAHQCTKSQPINPPVCGEIVKENGMPGPEAGTIWLERDGKGYTAQMQAYFWTGNKGNRLRRVRAIGRRLIEGSWFCGWCGGELSFDKRADARFCRESCRKKAARQRREGRHFALISLGIEAECDKLKQKAGAAASEEKQYGNL